MRAKPLIASLPTFTALLNTVIMVHVSSTMSNCGWPKTLQAVREITERLRANT